ncbi:MULTISPECIES: hypothetical protein [unclassified Serratia (in: enterobacteria)]|uniref:RipA family octameric membrane protein n=1 Tax=unclassified Serratia (in: enterobacteria) TaxID=2647522 RepID=UPI0027FA29DA|nr:MULTISPECIES: hypothetical protein [unclassified Serratia (in: enterobacteria)]MDQ7101849.1 hypothetical protein [Serratia sp. MF2]MDQ7104425.1 hypothetical protein [Serratia sp. MF1(2023)]
MENNEKATEYTFPIESKEYFEHLLGKSLSDGEKFTKQDYRKIEEAYNKAHDIRKFEIELYWKRSTYFWTFISVLVAVCGVISTAFLKDGKFGTELRSFLFCTSILGYFISLHFLITCISGKQWQENWERHIDILESYFSGNIYKLNLVKGDIRYSISLSNEVIASAITFVWIIIIIYSMLDIPKAIIWIGVAFLIVITAAYLWMSLKRSNNTNIDIAFNIRTVKSANIIGKSNRYLEQKSTKWANRIITGVVIVLLTLVVLLLISILYYSTDKKMELGSLTDWISAGANICMAGAALYAGAKAINFFKAQAIDHAQNLLARFNDVKVDIEVFNFDLLKETTCKVEHLYNANENTNQKINISSVELNNLDNRLRDLRKKSMDFLTLLNSTKRFGYTMKEEYRETLKTKISDYSNTAVVHLTYYKKDPNVIAGSILLDGLKHLNKDQSVKLDELKKTLHATYLLFDDNIENIFTFK